MNKEKLVLLGYATKPHGLRGEVLLKVFNTIDSQLCQDKCIIAMGEFGQRKLSVQKIRWGQKVIALFHQIQNRTDLEALLPFEIYLERSEFNELKDGQYYLVDLLEYQVYCLETQSFWGQVDSFDSNGAQDLLVLKSEDESLTLPLVESFFPKIDHQKKIIYFNKPIYL